MFHMLTSISPQKIDGMMKDVVKTIEIVSKKLVIPCSNMFTLVPKFNKGLTSNRIFA